MNILLWNSGARPTLSSSPKVKIGPILRIIAFSTDLSNRQALFNKILALLLEYFLRNNEIIDTTHPPTHPHTCTHSHTHTRTLAHIHTCLLVSHTLLVSQSNKHSEEVLAFVPKRDTLGRVNELRKQPQVL